LLNFKGSCQGQRCFQVKILTTRELWSGLGMGLCRYLKGFGNRSDQSHESIQNVLESELCYGGGLHGSEMLTAEALEHLEKYFFSSFNVRICLLCRPWSIVDGPMVLARLDHNISTRCAICLLARTVRGVLFDVKIRRSSGLLKAGKLSFVPGSEYVGCA
jgi:hypothetical protein